MRIESTFVDAMMKKCESSCERVNNISDWQHIAFRLLGTNQGRITTAVRDQLRRIFENENQR